MRELHDAVAAAGWPKYAYAQTLRAWIGLCRYSIHIPHVNKYANDKCYPHSLGEDLERAFRGIYIAADNDELSGGDSLLSEAIEYVGANNFGACFESMRHMDKPEHAHTLQNVVTDSACKVMAYIADALQSGAKMRKLDRAFWSHHVGGVQNDPSFFDRVTGNRRSRYETIGRALKITVSDEPWQDYLKVTPVSPLHTEPSGPTQDEVNELRMLVTQTTDALVQDAYSLELMRLRMKGAARVETPGLDPQSELSKQFAAARDKAQKDFLAEQPVPEPVQEIIEAKIAEAEIVEPEVGAPEVAEAEPIEVEFVEVVPPAPPPVIWPDDTEEMRPSI